MERRFLANPREMVETCFGKENMLRRLMLLLAVLAAMMLAASPVLAWQPGPGEGSKYSRNYYPNTYFKYCEPDGAKFWGNTKANKWCDHYYTEYQKKTFNGKQYYYVHVYYKWKTTSGGTWQTWDDWYYCQYHKYDDRNSTHPYFRAWVTYQPTGKGYWESFYWHR
jgi:hypothetical protein